MKVGRLTFNFGIGILLLSILFKYMKNQYTKELVVFGLSVFFLGYIILFIQKNKRTFIDFVRLTVLLSWIAFIVSKLYKLPVSEGIETILICSFVSWFLIEGGRIIKSSIDFSTKKKILVNGLFILTICLITATLIMKWYGMNYFHLMLKLAIGAGVLWIILNLLKKK